MGLDNTLKEVKKELSSDEKLLEQAFQLERFYKKNKKVIIATIILLIGAFVGYKVYDYVETSKLLAANEALLKLEKNPNDTNALNILKEKNPKLYNLYIYSTAVNNQDSNKLNSLKVDDEFLNDVIKYHINVAKKSPTDSIYYKNLSIVEKAYLLIKEGKKKEAKDLLITIPKDSAVAGIAKLLEHFTIN